MMYIKLCQRKFIKEKTSETIYLGILYSFQDLSFHFSNLLKFKAGEKILYVLFY